MSEFSFQRARMTAETFAAFGERQVAYVRPIRCEEAATLYPKMPYLSHWFTLFSLHAADGSLIAIKDSREDAIEDASTRSLKAMSVH